LSRRTKKSLTRSSTLEGGIGQEDHLWPGVSDMSDQPVHRNILAVDIEGFGRQERDDPGRIGMREALFAVLAEGLELAGIDRGQWEQSDLGDGILVLISPEVSKVRLIDPLIGEVTFALQRYNDTAGPASRMRLRAVIHAGEVVRHKQTHVGSDLNYAFRLLDSETLRRWLADSTTDLALMVSDPIYQGVIRHGWGRISVTSYRQVLVTAKDLSAHAWVHVPEPAFPDATPPVPGSGPGGSRSGPGNPSRRVSNLPPRNPRFTGRDELLVRIAQSLIGNTAAASPPSLPRGVALYGLRGVGKTQLALEYAHRHAADYDIIWWIPAELPVTIPGALVELGTRLGLTLPERAEQEQVASEVLAELANRDRWLLLFDNASHPQDVAAHLPSTGQGHVLITSRITTWGGVASRVKVAVLDPGEAEAFLLHRTESDGDANAGQLAEELGFLPLALEQAAAYMEQAGLTLGEYLALFRRRRRSLLGKGEPLAYGSTVPATFRLAFERIAEQSPAAMQLLSLCAFLAPEVIPHWLVTASPGLLPAELAEAAADESIYTDTVGALHGLSLVERDEQGLRVHRLVQAVARGELAADTEAAWATRAVQLLREVWPAEPEEPSTWPRCLELLPHVLIGTEHAEQLGVAAQSTAWLLHGAGVYLSVQAELTMSKATLERGLAIAEGVYGPDHPNIAPILAQLGRVLRRLGDKYGTYAALRRALSIDEAAHGPEHPQVAWTLTHLGRVQRQLGNTEAALTTLRRALAVYETAYGPQHPEVAWTLTHLGRVVRRLGDYAGAHQAMRRALDINEAHYGAMHPAVGWTVGHLGRVLRCLGDYAAARAALQRSLTIHKATFGPYHPQTAWSLVCYATVLRRLGELEEAHAALRRALEIHETAYGSDHSQVAWNLTHLGRVLLDMGDFQAAHAAVQRGLAINEAVYGRDHPESAWTLTHLASVLRHLGDLDGAQAALEQALTINEATYGTSHPEVAATLTVLGLVLADLGELDGACAALQRALEIAAAAYGSDHAITRRTREALESAAGSSCTQGRSWRN
jgi:tetratricopeptide (TPR) repeat protein